MSQIRFATLEDVLDVKNIIDEGISENYYTKEDIIDYITDDNKFLLVVVSEDDKPISAMFCAKGGLKEMCDNERIPYPDSVFDKYNENTKTIVYKTASTYNHLRSKGYVGWLFEEYNNIFNDIDHEIRIGLALILPDGEVPIRKLVEKYDFKPAKVFEMPWHNLKSYCWYCKKDFCECNGLLYIKENNVE